MNSAMIRPRDRPVPRGPRTASMNGKPNFAFHAAFSRCSVSNSSGVHRPSPARDCSSVDSAVIALATIALPASSGCERSSASRSASSASRTTLTSASFSCARLANGRRDAARSTIQGECS